MNDKTRQALAALNAGAAWGQDTTIPAPIARSLLDHVASLEVSHVIDIDDLDAVITIIDDIRDAPDRFAHSADARLLRHYIETRFGAYIDHAAKAADKLRTARERARGEG